MSSATAILTAARPLGVRDDLPLETATVAALMRLEQFDLTPVRDRLARVQNLPDAVVDALVFEFRRYLGMVVVHRRPVAMLSRAVDEVWHLSLLFTRMYARMCDEVFGHFVHHDPAVEPWHDVDRRWHEFGTLYSDLYGPLGVPWQNARKRQGF